MHKILYAMAILVALATQVSANTPFAFTCTAEEDDRGPFLMELYAEDYRGAVTRSLGEEVTREVTWQEIGNATIVTDMEHGYVVFAFVSETLTGWVPYEIGEVVPATCVGGGIAFYEYHDAQTN